MQITLIENGVEKVAKLETIDFTSGKPTVSVLTGEALEAWNKAETLRLADSIRDTLSKMRTQS